LGLNLSDVPPGTNLFIDSNIFLYVFLKHPLFGRSCKDFFKRIEGMEITGFVDEFVLNEMFHKLMVTAIVNRYRISPQEAVTSMKNNPGILKELPELWQACELLKTIEVKIVPGPFFPDSLVVAQEYHLLATDAIHVAAMNKAGIIHIVSNDTDFSRVQFLQVWRPDKTEAPA
jgi:predicted nucleic acid-binding protein